MGDEKALVGEPGAIDTPEMLYTMNEDKDMNVLADNGGVEGLAKVLGSDALHGLAPEGVANSLAKYGPNRHKEVPPKNFFVLCWETMQDPIIILLMVAALVSTVLGAAIPDERAKNGWVEGVAIWIAVLVVILVGAGNDYQKDQQFRKLNAQRQAVQVKVVRGGAQVLVDNTDIVVGDVLLLDTGDKVCADGVVIESFGLVLDEASLTGEGDPIHKNRQEDPWVRSGTQVTDGSGKILIVAVGPNSEWGKIMSSVNEEEDEQTPLQVKLEWVAAAVGKVGFAVAICCFIVLLIKWCVENKGFPLSKINDNGPIQFFLYGVTIIVVAVPEGLPLAVTISLAYSMKKMMQDNNFVRVLAACETMGGATAICSDKTGTLTENRMTVITGWFCGKFYQQVPQAEELPSGAVDALKANICMTSKAFLTKDAEQKVVLVGNRTECALLIALQKWHIDYVQVREHLAPSLFRLYGFSSERKMSACVVRESDKLVVYNKGAAEWVLRRCSNQMTVTGKVIPLTAADKDTLMEEVITAMAKVGLRCIALTTADLPLEDSSRPADFFEDAANVDDNLTLLAIVGIKDPVRPEVPAAVDVCQDAGIVVRMVTGDNIHTAKHIARECGILPEGSTYSAIEGPDFRKLTEDQLNEILPSLRVLARSSPEDKKTLVKALRSMGEVVAVTGDGTNDAAALKASDVGLAMGIAGTEVAKEAADIVILDDNFSSIVKSVLWGRSVFTNIRKFLQFQLTVNFVALVTAFVGAVAGGIEPLTVLQLLWVNMIMDSLGALALATEPPIPELLLLSPYGRDEPLITHRMWKHIGTQGLYQLFWMFACVWALPAIIPHYSWGTETDYYLNQCVSQLNGSSSAANAQQFCDIMNYCGFPFGNASSVACPLYSQWDGNVPSNQALAICGSTANPTPSLPCATSTLFDSARGTVGDGWDDYKSDQRTKSLSVLFNAFIWLQLGNEINSRRIHDEYNIFGNLHKSYIFLAVLLITAGAQAIIMNFLGSFFKVVPINWQEWLACIAIGAGSWPVSLLIRFISRVFNVHAKDDQRTGVDRMYHATKRRSSASVAAQSNQRGTDAAF